jgi:hypothetical protein
VTIPGRGLNEAKHLGAMPTFLKGIEILRFALNDTEAELLH